MDQSLRRTFNQQPPLRLRSLSLMTCCLAVTLHAADAGNEQEQPRADKSHYHLFNPTPRSQLREMSTDRPDKTESAYTVDAGHFQVEMDLLSYGHDRERSGGATTTVDAFAIAPINFKVGLCNQVDLQVVVETWNYVRTKVSAPGFKSSQHQRGFGDITTRLKYNFWGNDGGRTAFAATPYVKFPTSHDDIGNRAVEGGLVLPLAVELPHGFYLGATTRFDAVQDEDDSGYHTEFINSFEFGHDLIGSLYGYVEFFSAVSTERDADWEASFNVGMVYRLTQNVLLNAGVDTGVTRSADDLSAYAGLTWRF